ncbi:peptidoglycan DD-metalloendopeptidase family protein [Bacillus horti]|uniref:Murein DD-endopeptidase MepM/ murein hydrolase activator NlpD n=1 Tax=Caldalkalibacillus horti TaxID=77523 RepID=A0ABT9W1L4_9BACI|nr:M23 family metallopeptidase [Bacillus horti]MDQ0167139.1 murein DD-endopeptidase MepM/ murein hydrolase activator NlpD [Bacillus horti]
MSTFQDKLKKASMWMKARITQGIEHGKRTISQYKKHIIISGISAGVLFTVSAVGYTYYQSQVQPIYHVYFQNQQIGTVDNPDIVNQWIDNKIEAVTADYEDITFQTNHKVAFEEEELYKPSFDNQATLEELEGLFEIRATAIRLEVDGEFIGYIPNEESVYTLLDEMKSEYVSEEFLATMQSEGFREDRNASFAVATLANDGQIDPDESENTAVNGKALDISALDFDKLHMTKANVQQQIGVHETVVNPEDVMNAEQLSEIFHGTSVEEQIYEVQSGDVLGSIAQKHDMTTSELLALNPELQADQLLQIGQEVVITGSKAFISVETVEQVKKVEKIPFTTDYQQTDELYKGERRTVTHGSEGQKAVVYEIVKVDGKEITRQAIDSEVMIEPETEVVLVGTKVKPSRGSGQFSWPAVGGKVSSGFGPRWGRQHNGIDISSVRDKTIKAADNGKVTTAGYHRGYGNYVVIDHGNGYETLYGHLESISVSKGDVVQTGDKLGVMGSTGNSTGIHLHFEIIKNGRNLNPAQYVSR